LVADSMVIRNRQEVDPAWEKGGATLVMRWLCLTMCAVPGEIKHSSEAQGEGRRGQTT